MWFSSVSYEVFRLFGRRISSVYITTYPAVRVRRASNHWPHRKTKILTIHTMAVVMWMSWQSGCFRNQRSAVRFQFIGEFLHKTLIYCIEKTKIKKKRPGMAHYLFKKHHYDISIPFCQRRSIARIRGTHILYHRQLSNLIRQGFLWKLAISKIH